MANRKGYRGIGMNGRMARWYERTRRNDMADFRRQAQAAAANLPAGAEVLEVAPGPGFFAIELAKLGDFHITGLDISRSFIELATCNARQAGVNVDFREGNASAMPFADESFDAIFCTAAFKNFSEPIAALNEMHRVLRPGGRALIVDLRGDASLADINAYVKQSGRTRLDAWLTTRTFRHVLLRRAYTRDQFLRMAESSRFGSCQIRPDSIGFEISLTRPAPVTVGTV